MNLTKIPLDVKLKTAALIIVSENMKNDDGKGLTTEESIKEAEKIYKFLKKDIK